MAPTRGRLGVLGGSFDPPHMAHLAVASEASHALGLERVLFVPAAAPPHKGVEQHTPAGRRLEMTELAVRDDDRFVASDVEIEHELVYTADTLRAVAEARPGAELFFIMGADSLMQLYTWHAPEEIVELASLLVAPRPGHGPDELATAAARWGEGRVTLLDLPLLDVSSTDVRARVASGRPIRYLVPSRVEEYIAGAGLYR